MKKIVFVVLLFLNLTVSAQAYFPSFNSLFLNDPDESLFSPELNYFREELKVVSKTLYVGDVQTATSRSNGFYSFKVVPTSVREYNFLNSGVFLRFNVNLREKHASFPVTFEEFIDEDESGGKGRIDFDMQGISLAFDQKLIKVVNPASVKNKADFTITNAEYKISKTNLEIVLKGYFATDVIIKGKKIKKDAISFLTLNADKIGFDISYETQINKEKIVVFKKKN
ncbi:hypothetical protein [Flavobacterium sp. LC2016-01]|uniref:hypothetical protein n=1 Tax=Flavobacterium sp. LC2016-01 TaxID=2675876 RepID=UPI0012BADCC2|nr:hypothetical protein [Flavobacterium sp. LC2016-01]MTH14660.1 hypothetical protein [Flavobacterium sp. LC2016-01]